MTPQRIQLRRAKGWRKPDNTVVVARPTPWGNPFVVGTHGTRAECVRLYRLLMTGHICVTMRNFGAQGEALAYAVDHIEELRGRNLACWCPLDQPCHGDVLLELANGAGDQ